MAINLVLLYADNSMMNKYPSLQLLREISLESDRLALNELLERRKLFVYGSERMLLAQFLWKMKEDYQKRLGSQRTVDEIVDSVYDLTLAKFINMPLKKPVSRKQDNSESSRMKHADVDCRLYYKAVLSWVVKWKAENPDAGIVEEEKTLGLMLQKMVGKHFRLSELEVRRSNIPFRRRYFWKVKGKSITLWYPVQISGRYFREWLEKHITDPNPSKLGETERIQKEVDRSFARHVEIRLDERWERYEWAKEGRLLADGKELDWMPEKVNELMLTVAEEKVSKINQMRPAIRDLGKDTLYQMIIRIFEDIHRRDYDDIRIAKDFGLSKATFSRFAGSKWVEKLGKQKRQIPDLWQNMAKIMAANQDFMELALAVGILPKLKKVMGMIGVSNV